MNKKEEAWRKVSDWEEKIEQTDFYKWVEHERGVNGRKAIR